jgi:Type ISP C-terminal specificity domain
MAVPPTNLFFHTLATMHSPQYRTENSGALLGDWPRIPIPATADLLSHSASLGHRLAELLDAESSLNFTAEWSFLAALKLPTPQNLAENLKLTAGWGSRGQGGSVMPGRGVYIERDWTSSERDKLTTLASSQHLTLEVALSLLGETCVDVHLNGSTYWNAIPSKVWDYTLGGYQVLKKWLSYRELPLLGRPLQPDEAAYVSQVARALPPFSSSALRSMPATGLSSPPLPVC